MFCKLLIPCLECGEDAGAFAATFCRWLSDLSDVACGILDGDGCGSLDLTAVAFAFAAPAALFAAAGEEDEDEVGF